MIEFEHVKIGYNKPLASVQLTAMERGKVYALIGSNGSGKSTFLQTICGQLAPFSGKILYNGVDLQSLSPTQISQLIAFVPARFPEVDYMTAFSFIALGRTPYLSYFGQMTEEDQQITTQVMNQVGVSHLKDKYTTELSDGERQLCAVARALVQQTPIIILDEPSGYLDYKNKRRLMQTLHDVTKKLNLLTLFSTHDIETLSSFDIDKIGITVSDTSQNIESKIITVEKKYDLNILVDQFYR